MKERRNKVKSVSISYHDNEIAKYREVEAVNQSLLKSLENGLEGYEAYLAQLREEPTENLLLGSLVDAMLTHHPDSLSKEYSVMEIHPRGKACIDWCLNELGQHAEAIKDLDDLDPLIARYLEGLDWQRNWKVETRMRAIKEGLEGYLRLRLANLGGILPTLVSQEIWDKAADVAESIRNSPFSADLLRGDTKYQAREERLYIAFQEPLYGTLDGIAIKGLPDILVKNPEEGSITIIDIKTTSGFPAEFPKAVRRFRYDIQAAFYTELVAQNYPEAAFSGRIRFQFIVAGTRAKTCPLLFECTPQMLERGRIGADGRMGFLDLLQRYADYKEHGFDMREELLARNPIPLF